MGDRVAIAWRGDILAVHSRPSHRAEKMYFCGVLVLFAAASKKNGQLLTLRVVAHARSPPFGVMRAQRFDERKGRGVVLFDPVQPL